jgi:hypothetical protein
MKNTLDISQHKATLVAKFRKGFYEKFMFVFNRGRFGF